MAANPPNVVHSSSAYALLEVALEAVDPPSPGGHGSHGGDEGSTNEGGGKLGRHLRLFTYLRHPLARSLSEY